MMNPTSPVDANSFCPETLRWLLVACVLTSCAEPADRPPHTVTTGITTADDSGGTNTLGTTSETSTTDSGPTSSDPDMPSDPPQCEHSMDCPELLVCVEDQCISSDGVEFDVVVYQWEPTSCDDLLSPTPSLFYRAFVDGLEIYQSMNADSCPAAWILDDFSYNGGLSFSVEVWEEGAIDTYLRGTIEWDFGVPVPPTILHEQSFAGQLPSGDTVSLGFYPQ